MVEDLHFLVDAKFVNHLVQELSVHVVVQVFDGNLDLGRVADVVLVDLRNAD